MSQDESHSGIPTRAIHESYLDMQRALKAYREAKDAQNQHRMQDAHGDLQQSVLTFYELLRPHLKNESAVKDWWNGKPPNYNHNGTPPDPDDGKGVLQVQTENMTISLNGEVNPEKLSTLEDWHEAIGLNGTTRIVGIAGAGDGVFVKKHNYQLGLRHLDSWETKYKRVQKPKSGFMSHKTEETIEKQRIPIDRLRRAARELSEVAEKLGALSDFDASEPRTEISKELIEEVEEWRQNNIE